MVLSGITPMIILQPFKPLLLTSVINGGACSVKATLVTKQLILSRKRLHASSAATKMLYR